ncbi:DUF6233 domain-containing protein [Streptomyces griseoluteus]|uniref:DUF6233 domain-containing protein n=1 Tax=Streptomyces griseoluteus TaxID=29306 RepID=UPI0033D7E892
MGPGLLPRTPGTSNSRVAAAGPPFADVDSGHGYRRCRLRELEQSNARLRHAHQRLPKAAGERWRPVTEQQARQALSGQVPPCPLCRPDILD